MSLQDSNKLAVATGNGDFGQAEQEVGLLQCLIVSTNDDRRRMLRDSAQLSGWNTIVCDDCDGAMVALDRYAVQLGLVDMQDRSHTEFKALLEKIAPTIGLLLVVCGNEGNIREEILVRQLGAWLYLPSVEDMDDLTTVCDEARLLTERMRKNSPRRSFGAV
jgi:DNA-binding NtrC family response regulator